MTTAWRRRLAVTLCAVLPALARADDGKLPPSIHGRTAAPEDAGPPPKRSLSNGKDCASRRRDFSALSAFKNQKMVWNASRIASVGASYRIPACRAAGEAFDKAAELASGNAAGTALRKASGQALNAASSCQRAFDALYYSECGGSAADADCAAAGKERQDLAYLADQIRRFQGDLRGAAAQDRRLARCTDTPTVGAAGPAGAPRPAPAERPAASIRAPAPIAAPALTPPLGLDRAAPPPVRGDAPQLRPSLLRTAETAAKSTWDGLAQTGEALWSSAKAVADGVKEKAKDLNMQVVDLRYRANRAVVNPLRRLAGEGNFFRDALDRVRLNSLENDIQTLTERAGNGNAAAVDRLKDIYAHDIEREDYQPQAEQKRIKGLALRIADDKEIWSAYMDWLKLKTVRQETVLQKLADYTAGEFGTAPLTLIFQAMEDGLFGYHSFDPEEIALNTGMFGYIEQGRFRIVNTPPHETTHGYQHKIAREKPASVFSLAANVGDQTILMSANEEHYMVSSKDYNAYYTQPMERHARDVGFQVIRAIHARAQEERARAAAKP